MEHTNILVYGAGALGMFFASLLSSSPDLNIFLFTRNEEKAKTIAKKGIIVNNQQFFNVICVSKKELFKQNYDYILITIPTYALISHLPLLKCFSDRDCFILSLQNGLFPHKILSQLFPSRYIKCVTLETCEKINANKIRRKGNGITFLEKKLASIKLFKILNSCGIPAKLSEEIDSIILNKFIFYSLVSSCCIIENKSVRDVLSIPQCLNSILNCLKEVNKLFVKLNTKPLNIPFPVTCKNKSLWKKEVKKMVDKMKGELIPSALRHYRNKEITEIEYLIGEVYRLVKKYHLPRKNILKMYEETQRQVLKRKPYIATWRVTYDCNLNCIYCKNIRPMKKYSEKYNYSPLVKRKLLRKINENQITILVMNGGECLLVDPEQFVSLIKELKETGVSVGIVTNGTLLHKHFRTLKMLDYISISIDSINPKIGDITRGNGTTEKVMKIIPKVLKINKNVSVEMTLNKWNVRDLPISVEKLIGMDIKEVHINPIRGGQQFQPSSHERKKCLRKLILLKKKYPKNLPPESYFRLIDFFIKTEKRPKLPCFSGSFFLKLDPNGRIICNYQNMKYRKTKCRTCFCCRDIYNMYLSGMCSFEELPILSQKILTLASKGSSNNKELRNLL